MALNDKLKKLREYYQLSQGDVSEKLGVQVEVVESWEKGESKPSLDQLDQLADLFNTTASDLLKEDEEEVIEDVAEKEVQEDSETVQPPFSLNKQFIEDFKKYRPRRWMAIIFSICSSYFMISIIIMIVLGCVVEKGWSWSWTFIMLTPFSISIPLAIFSRKISVLSFGSLFLFIYLFTCSMRAAYGLDALWHPLWILLLIPLFIRPIVAPIDIWLAKRKIKKDIKDHFLK